MAPISDSGQRGARTCDCRVIYDNLNSESETSNWSGGNFDNSTITHTCTTPASAHAAWGTGNTTNNPQLDAVCHLTKGSPCINSGIEQNWMINAPDLDGRQRIDRFSGLVDMGCYEYIAKGTMIFVE